MHCLSRKVSPFHYTRTYTLMALFMLAGSTQITLVKQNCYRVSKNPTPMSLFYVRVKNFLLSMSNSAFFRILCMYFLACGRKQNLTFRKQKILDPILCTIHLSTLPKSHLILVGNFRAYITGIQSTLPKSNLFGDSRNSFDLWGVKNNRI